MIDVILQAFASIVLDPVTLGLMLVGTLAGILAGAIPGFTIAMGVILTLPIADRPGTNCRRELERK